MTKYCHKCHKETERYADGRCKPCRSREAAKYYAANSDKKREQVSAYRSANTEKIRERKAKFYADNREKILASQSKYCAENREKIRERGAKYRAANKDQIRKRDAEWKAANPEKRREYGAKWLPAYRAANADKFRIYAQNRRARASGGKLSIGLDEKLFKLQRGKCACCKQPLGDNYHLDHIMPIALGGTNTDDNIQLLRAECNLKKNAKHPVDFMQQRGFLL